MSYELPWAMEPSGTLGLLLTTYHCGSLRPISSAEQESNFCGKRHLIKSDGGCCDSRTMAVRVLEALEYSRNVMGFSHMCMWLLMRHKCELGIWPIYPCEILFGLQSVSGTFSTERVTRGTPVYHLPSIGNGHSPITIVNHNKDIHPLLSLGLSALECLFPCEKSWM